MCQEKYNTKTKKKKYKHINYVERTQIERWYNIEHKKKSEIAKLLNKSERTIRREFNRGKILVKDALWRDKEIYSADTAQRKYDYNMQGKGPELKIGSDYELAEYIENGVKKERKSPEILIAEIERKELKFKSKICAKTVRNGIHKGYFNNLSEKDMIYNKIYKEKNKKKYSSDRVPGEKSIEYRPKEANTREEYGNWEGDLVIGIKTKGAVLFTLTERKTREEIIIKLADKTAESVAKALDKIEKRYKTKFYRKFKTITFDNGPEFRNWESLEKSCRRKRQRISVYYAHPYRSGERGSNENNNRLIRRFIPKGIDITPITEEYIQKIEDWINNLPRPMFGFKTALEVA